MLMMMLLMAKFVIIVAYDRGIGSSGGDDPGIDLEYIYRATGAGLLPVLHLIPRLSSQLQIQQGMLVEEQIVI